MSGRPTKSLTLEEVRKAQRDSANKWYNDPKNKEKRKASMRDYYRRKKEQEAKKDKAND